MYSPAQWSWPYSTDLITTFSVLSLQKNVTQLGLPHHYSKHFLSIYDSQRAMLQISDETTDGGLFQSATVYKLLTGNRF